ncbi:hypothetical protein [Listeria costaricensis]|uniref:hypothetical protein n=1 Tax=Listeria costaricensis TaxID=2026604 RepID=UPI000C0813C5|nr:hypothetical protein [Listeria costaricensis]
MYIEYDEYELLELFLNEPSSLYDNEEDGEVSYTKKSQSDFELTLFIHTYQMECELYLSFKGKDIFSVELKEIVNIIKKDNIMSINSAKKELVQVYFGEDFNIRII